MVRFQPPFSPPPATLLDPHLRGQVPPDLTPTVEQAIAAGLTWVFAAMLLLAIVFSSA